MTTTPRVDALIDSVTAGTPEFYATVYDDLRLAGVRSGSRRSRYCAGGLRSKRRCATATLAGCACIRRGAQPAG